MSEYNILTDFYLPIKKDEEMYASSSNRILKENNIDNAELLGINYEDGAGSIDFKELNKKPELIKNETNLFIKDMLQFFFYDLPKDTFISILRGGANVADKFLSIPDALAKEINPTGQSNAKELRNKIDDFRKQLDNAQEESPFISKLVGMLGQDALYVTPIYNQLKKTNLPKSWIFPASVAIGTTLAFERKDSFFVNSETIKNLKTLVKIAPDTPMDEFTDYGTMLLEYTLGGVVADKVLQGLKFSKQFFHMEDVYMATGTAGTAGVVTNYIDKKSDVQQENKKDNLNVSTDMNKNDSTNSNTVSDNIQNNSISNSTNN